MESSQSRAGLVALLVMAALATLLVHAVYVPRHFPGEYFRAIPYLIVGWVAYTVVFYAVGRLVAEPPDLPSMRSGDIGVALVLGTLLVALVLDTGGLSPRLVPEAYGLLAIVLYAGLALVGWSMGQRTRAINRIAGVE
ncbi:hypothetical protein [Halovivax sp.]|uniref:hypothetical protein n=1 Tax=Halovivax sp. TaxID=1935978 RepID=UPI0025BECECD|nr:hypothetical protein [Halovivax sp.]